MKGRRFIEGQMWNVPLAPMLLLSTAGLCAAAAGGDVVQPSGKWCAETSSANGDGRFSYCALILTQRRESGPPETQAFAWVEAMCTRGKEYCSEASGVSQIDSGPAELHLVPGGLVFDEREKTRLGLFPDGRPAQIEFASQEGKVVLKGGSGPLGDDPLVWERDETFGDFQPSFPCDKARQKRDVAICRSPGLSFLDQQLHVTFERVLQRRQGCAGDTPGHGPTQAEKRQYQTMVRQSQTKWWSETLARCQSGDCVELLYRERMTELNRICPAHR